MFLKMSEKLQLSVICCDVCLLMSELSGNVYLEVCAGWWAVLKGLKPTIECSHDLSKRLVEMMGCILKSQISSGFIHCSYSGFEKMQ